MRNLFLAFLPASDDAGCHVSVRHVLCALAGLIAFGILVVGLVLNLVDVRHGPILIRSWLLLPLLPPHVRDPPLLFLRGEDGGSFEGREGWAALASLRRNVDPVDSIQEVPDHTEGVRLRAQNLLQIAMNNWNTSFFDLPSLQSGVQGPRTRLVFPIIGHRDGLAHALDNVEPISLPGSSDLFKQIRRR